METVAERFDVSTAKRTRFDPPTVTLRDGGVWPGIRLEQWEGESSELPESVLLQHGLSITLDARTLSEIRWSGHQPAKGSLLPSQLTLYPAGIPYRVNSRGYWRGLILGIDPSFVQATKSTVRSRPMEILPIFGASDDFLFHAISALAGEVREEYPNGPLYGQTIAVAIAAHLIRRYSKEKIEEQKIPDRRLQKIREFILDQLHVNISLDDMATYASMDVYAFARWFKASFGIPPHQYVMNARIQRAKDLLAGGSASIVEIALQCGFYSQSHFATAFRRTVGVPPTAYRRAARG